MQLVTNRVLKRWDISMFIDERLQKSLSQVKEDFKASTTKFPDCVECYALYAKVLQETGDLEAQMLSIRRGWS